MCTSQASTRHVREAEPGGRFLKNLTNVRRRKPIRLTLSYI